MLNFVCTLDLRLLDTNPNLYPKQIPVCSGHNVQHLLNFGVHEILVYNETKLCHVLDPVYHSLLQKC